MLKYGAVLAAFTLIDYANGSVDGCQWPSSPAVSIDDYSACTGRIAAMEAEVEAWERQMDGFDEDIKFLVKKYFKLPNALNPVNWD